MSDQQQGVEITIPVGLTAARIQRANPEIDEKAADDLAVELHEIVGWVRKFYTVVPAIERVAASEEVDLVDTMMRAAVDVWPADPGAAANEGIWVFERLDSVDAVELYERYLALCCRISPELAGDLGWEGGRV